MVRTLWLVGLALTASGVAWVAVLAIPNSQMQLTVPGRVRARALAIYLTAFQGGMAIGAAVWGMLADRIGPVGALLTAAALLAVGSAVGWRLSVSDTPLDRSPSLHWPEPAMVLDPAEADGPVLVTVEYYVLPDRADAFDAAMGAVGRSRRRTGALQWELYRDGAQPNRFLETFLVASWGEHLRQHGGRLTGADRVFEQQARALIDPDRPFLVSHLLPARASGPLG
ncbi:MFS transporter [Streptomyces sp. NPDC002643]